MTARKATPKPKVCITINPAKAKLTAAATQPAPPTQPHPAGSLIINALQADLLDALVLAGGQALTVLQLQDACGTCKTIMYRSFTDLKERELVLIDIQAERQRQLVTISMKGRRALFAYCTHQAHKQAHGLATPRTHIATDPYIPPGAAYQRNTGHPHIASRGVRC